MLPLLTLPDIVQEVKRIGGRGLVVLIVRHEPTTEVRREYLGRLEMLVRKGRLAGAGRSYQSNECQFRYCYLHCASHLQFSRAASRYSFFAPIFLTLISAGQMRGSANSEAGFICAGLTPLIKSRLREMESGQVLEVRVDDANARLDAPAWCRLSGNTLLAVIRGH